MKKILSVLLALVMVLSSMTLLVSATEPVTTPGAVTADGVNTGHIYYSQNFNDEALATLTDSDLADLLEWDSLPVGMSMNIVDGQLHIVSDLKDGNGENITDSYVTKLTTDTDMIKNALSIEYKITFESREDAEQLDSSAYLSLKVSKDADNYVLATPVSSGITSIPTGEMVVYGGSKQTTVEPLMVPENMTVDTTPGTQHVVKCLIDPIADGVQLMVDNIPLTNWSYGSRKSLNFSGSVNEVIGKTLELVVKPGVSLLIDDICVSEYAANIQITEVMANAGAAGRYQWIELYNPNTAPVNVYDYCVVIRNGVPTNNGSVGDETDVPNGSKTETKVDEDGNVYKVTSNTYSNWDKGGASTIGYFQPGAKQIVVAPAAEKAADRVQTFDSPALADGVLNPGETAIVLFPDTAIKGNNPVTDEAFREHMTKLGLPEDVDLYVCDNQITRCKCQGEKCEDLMACPNPYKYPFQLVNVTTEFFQVALMRVKNTATEAGDYKPEAIGKGVSASQQFAYYESYAVLSSKPSTSGTGDVAGFPVFTTSTVVDDAMPLNQKIYYFDDEGNPIIDQVNGDPEKGYQKFDIYTEVAYKEIRDFSGMFGTSAGAFGAANENSFEISYSQRTAPDKSQKWGWMYYNATQVRPGLGARELYYSPGYVPPACRDGVALEVTSSIDGSKTEAVAKLGADYTYNLTDPYGYEFEGMTIGDSDELVTKIPAAQISSDAELDITFHYKRLLPVNVYIQTTAPENGAYTLRLLGVTNHIKCQSLGFKIQMSWVNGEGETESRELYRECKFIYDSVSTVKNGQSVIESAESLGGEKLFAYHIEGIPADQENVIMTVTPYYIKGYADQDKIFAEDCTTSFVLNDTPSFDAGDYDDNKDDVDFEYDGSAS